MLAVSASRLALKFLVVVARTASSLLLMVEIIPVVSITAEMVHLQR